MNSIKKIIKKNWPLYAFLVLPLTYVVLFHYIPLAGAVIAVKDYSIRDGIFASPWIGFKYFLQFFNSPNFSTLITNTLALSVSMLIVGFPMPIFLAIALNEIGNQRYKKFVQTITYAPYFISTVVLVAIVMQFLDPRIGIINQIGQMFGGTAKDFMGDPKAFRIIYVLSGVWQMTGYNAIIYIAALSSVDPSLAESATVDGASKLQKIINIDIPSIFPTIIILLVLEAGRLMSVSFEKVYLMQNNLNLIKSEIISTYVYKIGIINAQYSYSTAIGLFNSVVNLIIIVLVNKAAQRMGQRGIW